MKLDFTFIRKAVVWYLGITMFGLLFIAVSASAQTLRSATGGSIVCFINFLMGLSAIEYSFHKNTTIFLKVTLGGMAVRLAVMATSVFVMIQFFNFDTLSFMISLLVFYSLNLILEIYYLNNKVTQKDV